MFGFIIPVILIRITTMTGLSPGFAVEGGQTGAVSIVLAQQPTADVTIVLNYDAARFTASADTLTFTSANYATAQSVTLTPIDDASDDQGIDTVYVTYAVTSTDTDYNGYPAGRTEARIFDNAFDQATLTTDANTKFHYTETDETELLALRDSLIQFIFNASVLPTNGVDSVDENMTYNTYMNPSGTLNDSLAQVDKMIVNSANSFVQNIYYLKPATRNNKLVICSYGHGDSYNINGLPTAFEYFVTRGYDVLTAHSPARGENDSPLSHLAAGERHDSIVAYETGSYNPVVMWFEGYVRAINHMDSIHNYDNIYMTGISGGGYQTTILTAMDTRIEKSFEVAGTYPKYVRSDSNQSSQSGGDYEQMASTTRSSATLRNFTDNVVSYLDMYVLAGYQREHWQMLNEDDSCCFFGLPWKTYVPEVKRRFWLLSSGKYEFFQYSEPGQHTFNTTVLNKINSRL